MDDLEFLLQSTIKLHHIIRNEVVAACEQASLEELSRVAVEAEGDTIYAVDQVSEELLYEFFVNEVAPQLPIVLIAEGLEHGQVVLPLGSREEDAKWRVIMDPIDGTRGLMYQKRAAWILTGIAPNKGPETSLRDIEMAVQTEIPLVKQHLSDMLYAIRGRGANVVRYNRLTDTETPITLRPSSARTIKHGYAMLTRFFPGTRDTLAAIDEEIIIGALGPVQPGKAHSFEDQYISTGGQLYELMAGHDRFSADIRPLMETILARWGMSLGLACHPYDLCAELIAREMGVIVTDEHGKQLDARLNVEDDVSWAGYANAHVQAEIEPLLQKALGRRGLI